MFVLTLRAQNKRKVNMIADEINGPKRATKGGRKASEAATGSEK